MENLICSIAGMAKIKTPLYHWRIKRGLSQIKLAEAAGDIDANLSRYETGKVGFPVEKWEAYAKVLECTVAELIGIEVAKEDIMAFITVESQHYLKKNGRVLASDDFGRLLSRLYPLAERSALLNDGKPELTKLQISDALRSIAN